jgi:hypothetical protein
VDGEAISGLGSEGIEEMLSETFLGLHRVEVFINNLLQLHLLFLYVHVHRFIGSSVDE